MSGAQLEHGCLNELAEAQYGVVRAVATERHRLPIAFDDVNKTLPDVIRETRRLRGKVDVYIVDHSSIITVPGRDKVEGVASVSLSCKQVLAVESDAVCILLSQFNERDSGESRPGLANVYGGGPLKQDCNVIMILHRESYGGKNSGDGAGLTVPFNRDSRYGGTIKLLWDEKVGCYRDPA